MHTITLITGDWSGDGHEKTDSVTIYSNLNMKELEAAFTRGEQVIGINFADQFSEYEARTLPYEMIQKMSKHFDTGFDVPQDIDPNEVDSSCYDEMLYSREYTHFWLEIAKIGNPELVYEYCKTGPTLSIGGYGLFY